MKKLRMSTLVVALIGGLFCSVILFSSFAYATDTLPILRDHINTATRSNYTGFALVIIGIGLIVAEMHVPGFGLPALGGIICMGAGSFLLLQVTDPALAASRSAVIAIEIATLIIFLIVTRAVITTHRKKTQSGKEGMTGECGVATSTFTPQGIGKVFVHGETWDARSSEPIKEGEPVTIIAVDRLVLTVIRTVQK